MKKRETRFAAIFLLGAMALGMMFTAAAVETRASDFFAARDVWCTPQGNGKFLVEYDISATEKMDELGAKAIYIYKQQSDGKYDLVYTYSKSNYPEFIEEDTASAYGSVTYQGTSGVKYYADVALYAKNYDGDSETIYMDSAVITA